MSFYWTFHIWESHFWHSDFGKPFELSSRFNGSKKVSLKLRLGTYRLVLNSAA